MKDDELRHLRNMIKYKDDIIYFQKKTIELQKEQCDLLKEEIKNIYLGDLHSSCSGSVNRMELILLGYFNDRIVKDYQTNLSLN